MIGRRVGYAWSIYSETLGEEYAFRFLNGDMVLDRNEDPSHSAFLVTTTDTARDFGRSAAVPDVLRAATFALGDRIIGNADSVPTTGSHARGEVVFNNQASAEGKVGWVCVSGGSPGTWKAFGVIDA